MVQSTRLTSARVELHGASLEAAVVAADALRHVEAPAVVIAVQEPLVDSEPRHRDTLVISVVLVAELHGSGGISLWLMVILSSTNLARLEDGRWARKWRNPKD